MINQYCPDGEALPLLVRVKKKEIVGKDPLLFHLGIAHQPPKIDW
jgi:hypothetical protein